MQRRWDDDDQLMEDLADAMVGIAPMAESVARKGEGAFAWHSVDEDLLLASLSFDSAIDHIGERRSDPRGARVLVFHASPLSIELEVTSGQILGQIDPPGVGQIILQTVDDSTIRVEADDLGFFVAPRPEGLVRLRCDTPTGRLVTDWVRL